jgi:hypothetical protein
MEIDRLNARAQHLRAERGELGSHEIPLSAVHYGLRQGDHVAFITQHRQPGQPRVENGTRGETTRIGKDGALSLKLDGSNRLIQLAGEDVESLRLAYAHHVYRQQGATVDRSIVLTGGWQTSKETAYVQATRARKGTNWYLARDQLGEEGQDPDRITRLAQRMTHSLAHTPSLTHRETHDRAWSPARAPVASSPSATEREPASTPADARHPRVGPRPRTLNDARQTGFIGYSSSTAFLVAGVFARLASNAACVLARSAPRGQLATTPRDVLVTGRRFRGVRSNCSISHSSSITRVNRKMTPHPHTRQLALPGRVAHPRHPARSTTPPPQDNQATVQPTPAQPCRRRWRVFPLGCGPIRGPGGSRCLVRSCHFVLQYLVEAPDEIPPNGFGRIRPCLC